ncbi:MAG TPA: hypothetical protein VGI39_21905, partial [Polyangiaceae bacterium]
MREPWLTLVEGVLRPLRPQLERCERERARHLAERRPATEARRRAQAECVAGINAGRAAVFAADDGVVSARMTELEREWRRLSRSEEDAVMDLWAKVAPSAWIDRKRWRDSSGGTRLEAAVLLASDVEGVEAAEAAVRALRTALARWGTPVATRIRWCGFSGDYERTGELLAAPLRAALEALGARDGANQALRAARLLELDVEAAGQARFPRRPALTRALAHAA